MNRIQALLPIIFFLSFAGDLSANEPAAELWGGSFNKLKSRIIRSVAIAPHNERQIIAGNKGNAAGDAKVIASHNGGVSWRFLNGGKSLAANATDVQAVSYVTPTVILAGTWKHGLYRSSDSGESFTRVTGLPATDVRSILVQKSGRILIATGKNGIWKSDDTGVNWTASSQAAGYFWSLNTGYDPSVLFATSPNSGVYRSTDGGDNWSQIYNTKGLYESTSINGQIFAVGENGMLVSADNGGTWSNDKGLSKVRLASIQVDRTSEDILLIGSWAKGLWRYSTADKGLSRSVESVPVLHVRESSQAILLGSWGRGIHILPRSSRTEYLVDGARAGDTSVINELLADGVDPDSFDKNRNTALIYAGRDGLVDIAEQLIKNGADVNWIDGEGVTPLILAAFKNHSEVVRLLLDHGADKSVVDKFGRTAIDYALKRGESDPIAKLLR